MQSLPHRESCGRPAPSQDSARRTMFSARQPISPAQGGHASTAASYPRHRQAQLWGEKHGSTPISMFAQSQAPMVGFRLHMVASLYFEHEAHGRQSVGH